MTKSYPSLKDYIKIREKGWTGYVHPDFKHVSLPCLINPDSSDDLQGPVEKVQSSDTAEVFRYTIRSQEGKSEVLYMKRYFYRSPADAVISLFRAGRAKRAFLAGIVLERHRFQTPQSIAFLQKKDGLLYVENILISRAMTDAVAISDVIRLNNTNQQSLKVRDRLCMIAEFGRVVGRMHAMGICHGDMRWGNIFAAQRSSGWDFYLIDNERTRKYPILPFWLRLKNLVQLYIDRGSTTRTDQMRFWRAYIETSGISLPRSKSIAKAVLKLTDKRLKKRSLTHTGLKNDESQFHWNIQTAHCGNYRGLFLTEFCRGDKAASFLRQIETLTRTGTVLKDDTAARLVRCTYNNSDVVIKRYNHQGLWHSLRYTIKGSRAMKCWRFGHLMKALNIPCAAPVGVIEERKYGLIWQSYIINTFVEGPNIRNYLQADLPKDMKRLVLAKTQDLVEQLVKNNLIHNDFKHCNLLIQNDCPILIDLDSMRKHKNRWILSLYKRKMINKLRKRIYDGNSGF